MTNIGIDIGKDSFDACFDKDNKRKYAQFKNSRTGMAEFHKWLKQNGIQAAHLYMEATGRYGEALAYWAFDLGWQVMIINPCRVRKFAESEGIYNKTDRVDAGCILDFSNSTKTKKLRPWKPRSASQTELKEIMVELAGTEKMIGQVRNRSKSCIATGVLLIHMQETIAFLKKKKEWLVKRALEAVKKDPKLFQDFKTLKKIKGIGDKTALVLLARIDFDSFKKGRQIVAFAGLAPKKFQSGSTVRKRDMISRVGHADLRSAMYLPAVVAMTHDPDFAEYKQHLEQQGKPKKVIICAIMARLLRKAFAMIRESRREQVSKVA
jgi:transposase